MKFKKPTYKGNIFMFQLELTIRLFISNSDFGNEYDFNWELLKYPLIVARGK